jgi:hypothetical protein
MTGTQPCSENVIIAAPIAQQHIALTAQTHF